MIDRQGQDCFARCLLNAVQVRMRGAGAGVEGHILKLSDCRRLLVVAMQRHSEVDVSKQGVGIQAHCLSQV